MKKSIRTMAVVLTVAAVTSAIPVTAFAATNKDVSVKTVESTAEATTQGETIEPEDYTAYVNAQMGVNVREAANADSTIMTVYGLNTPVHVTGRVMEDGVATGWVQVDVVDKDTNELCNGFVKGEFLSECTTDPVSTPAKKDTQVNKQTPVMSTDDYSEEMMESDAIADVIDQAQDSGLFTQEEIDDSISEITELQQQKCTTDEEKMAQSDQISGILNEMQQKMIDNGYMD